MAHRLKPAATAGGGGALDARVTPDKAIGYRRPRSELIAILRRLKPSGY